MSSRAFRRLNRDVDVIRIKGEVENYDDNEEVEEDSGFISQPCKRKGPAVNPFALLVEGEEEEEEEEEENKQDQISKISSSSSVAQSGKKSKRKKKKKKAKSVKEGAEVVAPTEEGRDEVDAAVKEVNKLLGEATTVTAGAAEAHSATPHHHSLLRVDRRFLNADNEMKRIFGSKVVRGDQTRQKAHRKIHHRPTALATPKDTWPKIEKLGLSMELGEMKGGCQYFYLEHSPAYQKIQYKFWDSVETFDPNAIAAILHAHPYHIDSLLQMSEVSKMGEDIQTASELIERALYCFESSFHILFNYTQANCRLDYSRAENRSFFLTLFHHLSYVGRRGCHRTALEFSKLLLGLDPDNDPLCVLLMIDYYAIRAGEYHFLIDLFHAWEPHRNLSQLPNFAFSVPLAMFHRGATKGEQGGEEAEREASLKLQDALLTFPSLIRPLLDKCGVTMDPAVMKHPLFVNMLEREPVGLQLLANLYIERSYSVWKEPEVLTWLETNCRQAIARADEQDPLITTSIAKAAKRYSGVPRNIYRHIIISDLDRVVAALPPEFTQTSINMYDPLPPANSFCGYSRPERRQRQLSEDNENPFVLLIRSLFPNYQVRARPPMPEGGFGRLVHEHIAQLRERYERELRGEEGQGERQLPREEQLEQQQQEHQRGAVGGVVGEEGRPLDLHGVLAQLVATLRELIHGPLGDENSGEESD